jgi:4-hydroxymandelate synthase
MAGEDPQVFEDMDVDHVLFYVEDLTAGTRWLTDGYGLSVTAASAEGGDSRSVEITGGEGIRLVLSQPMVADHPGTRYLRRHGDGVADIALGVPDAAAAFHEAVRRGGVAIAAPAERGGVVTATIGGFGDVTHTFVQRPADATLLGGMEPVSGRDGWDAGLRDTDHFAICLEAGGLEPTVEFYQRVLDFDMTFTERIVVGSQAMNSKVVQSRSRAVTLTLIEPDTTRQPGQIDDFIANHGGAGVQHIAFLADDVVRAVGSIRDRGVEFLSTPATYYSMLANRLELSRHSVEGLKELSVLVDDDHYGQLFQIFARSVHPRRTFFLEIIERLGARTFGSGNIKALYEAVELQEASGRDDGVDQQAA